MEIKEIRRLSISCQGRKFKNKKTGKIYTSLGVACDATNSRAGNPVVMYVDPNPGMPDVAYVRNIEEFREKFVLVPDPPKPKDKFCTNCKNDDYLPNYGPCKDCYGYSNWVHDGA